MADFQTAVALTLQHEGGFTDNPADSGGATNMGVEQRDVPNTPIRTLTVAQAEEFYRERYWKPLYSQIANQDVASKLFDFGVLFGVAEAVKTLQRALFTTVDGNFGPATLVAVNYSGAKVLPMYKSFMKARAAEIATEHPQEVVFLKGWDTRIDS